MEESLNQELSGFERSMPFSREAEQSVLGAMLLDMECIPDVMQICKENDFYIDRHKELYAAIVDLYNIGKPIDMDDKKFMAQLKELEKAAKNEADDVRRLVSEMVPTYKYQE